MSTPKETAQKAIDTLELTIRMGGSTGIVPHLRGTPMLRFTLRIDCENSAFDDGVTPELARILRDLADRLEAGETSRHYRNLHDANGNPVGVFKLADEETAP